MTTIIPPIRTAVSTVTLPCGLRVVHERTASPVVHCGYVVGAGTRHEADADTGMAHFIEHMTFKGTARRTAARITNGLERYGGELNAYTNKQETVYYAVVLRRDFTRAADLLTDIVFHSTYPDREIRREVEVICDEIDSYKDSPADLIFDDFEARLFAGQPLGRDILGNPDRLRAYATADARRFADAYYCPPRATFFVRGGIDFNRVVGVLERLTADMPAAAPLPLPAQAVPRAVGTGRFDVNRGTHQAHVVLGAPTFGGRDDRRFALSLLNNVLGGPGMNSRLNLSLREKAGLVYSVESSLCTYPDAGWWSVYFGCDIADVDACLRRTERELTRLADAALTPSRLRAAQRQLCGQVGIAAEHAENHALALGKGFARYGVTYDPAAICARLAAVTADEVRAVAADVFAPSRRLTLIYC